MASCVSNCPAARQNRNQLGKLQQQSVEKHGRRSGVDDLAQRKETVRRWEVAAGQDRLPRPVPHAAPTRRGGDFRACRGNASF